MVVLTLSSLDCVMARSSILEAGPSIRFVSGIYSCGWGCYLFGFKAAEMLRTANHLAKVAVAVEEFADPGSQVELSTTPFPLLPSLVPVGSRPQAAASGLR